MILVGCGAEKLEHPAPAKDLYTGSLFRAARAFAEATDAPWFVLSAKHKLVHPETQLAPYDEKLERADAKGFGYDVLQALRKLGGPAPLRITLLAGRTYGDGLLENLDAGRFCRAPDYGRIVLDEPLFGLELGDRLKFFRIARQHGEAAAYRFAESAIEPDTREAA